jgi:NADH-quinone oxidoreductase subunit G
MCGQCIHACPVGAIGENEQIDEFLAAIADPEKIVVTQIAPAVRVGIAEEIGMQTGELSMEVFIQALRRVGFDYVLHTNFTADLTILEEGNELLKRLKEGGTMPMITSCSPGWVNFCETFYPDQLAHLSTCKSPQQMFGALVKTYWADKMGIDPAKIFSVSIMPCVAKKYEALRPEMNASGYRDVDLVLTTREVGRLFKMMSLDYSKLPESHFDSWMGQYTGAGVIFGATGGVLEAALRTVAEVVTGETLEDVNFKDVRGMTGVKEAEVDLKGTKVKVAAAHGLANARKIMDQIKEGQSPYHFIEIMACPGGCVGGGGQPITKNNAKRAERIEAIYLEDEASELRKSHINPAVKTLYDEFLHEPLGHKSHELLHTSYWPKEKTFL